MGAGDLTRKPGAIKSRKLDGTSCW